MANEETIVWISGASYGIGAGLARNVPYPNARVINLDIRESPLYETVSFDLTRPETWSAVRRNFEAELGKFRGRRAICMIVGHAALGQGLVAKVDADQYRTALIANGAGPLSLASDFLRCVGPAYESGVMVMSSGAAHAMLVGQSAYGAAKAGIEHWARVINRELEETRPEGSPRRTWVVAVRPGLVVTPSARETAKADPAVYPRAPKMAGLLERFGVSEDEAATRIWQALPPKEGETMISFDDAPRPARKG